MTSKSMGMEWQLIETAPKDGALILVGAYVDNLERRGWFVQSVFWAIKDPFIEPFWESYGGSYLPFCPKYWMPLPTPPVDEKAKAQQMISAMVSSPTGDK